ncbi:hypothetical protein LWI28_006390 [Acer negundo]|uniref:Glycosyltransferase family 92 protein n=1 Tax=Acer negundo TaxID=4023 RepID=A0AAD5JRW8_ACENE|nr:hypothetical protein LWI28_006390 [Acer negundo]
MLPLKKSLSAPALVYLVYQKMSLSNVLPETVRRRGSMTKLFLVFLTFFFFTYISLLFSRYAIKGTDLGFISASNPLTRIKNPDSSFSLNNELRVVEEGEEDDVGGRRSRRVSSSVRDFVGYESLSILMPAWEVLLIVSSEAPPLLKAPVGGGDGGGLYCLFSNNVTSEARYAGVLPFTYRTTFKCEMPKSTYRRRPYIQPVLTENPVVVAQSSSVQESQANKMELIRNTFFVYESLSTENDVILFVKGVNHRQGINRKPDEFRCVFEDGQKTTVKTAVTSSVQEVFRCHHPDLTAFGPNTNTNTNIKVSLEIVTEKRAVPSVALYAPHTTTTAPARRTIATQEPKKLLCACTMVYNVAKYLREWVTYYSKLGVEKFILYDNDSDDNLTEIVSELNREGFNVTTLLWLWPKTQEAGFSHNAVFSNDTCRWMMYMDVDEFVFAPSWINESQPSDQLLRSLYLNEKSPYVGQVSFRCNDFGPSDQLTHPVEGVTQGYTCYRWVAQQRHKSIVLLDAVDDSLVNVVHHFGLKRGFRTEQMGPESGVVNHYKYQAWPEFKAKFRRRVSAYVVDWRESLNPKSKDRTPGLGFEPVEPKGWPKMFCDIRDDQLKLLTRKWFGIGTETGSKMVWQQRRR